MFVYASWKYSVNITHSFLEFGHTQNEGVSIHATIERYAKGRKIYTLDAWCKVMESAKLTNSCYKIIKVEYNMIYNFKDLSEKMKWSKTLLNKNKSTSFEMETTICQ